MKSQMDTKIKLKTGDIVLNKETKCIFLITKTSRHKISVLQTNGLNNRKLMFDIPRSRFIEQLTSDRGKEILVYYRVRL